MSKEFSIPIESVVDLLGLERDPKHPQRGSSSFNVKCPFCTDNGYHLNINIQKNAYRCVKCSGDDKNTGVLDLYGRVRFGERLDPKSNSRKLYAKLMDELGVRDPNIGKKVLDTKKRAREVWEIFPADNAALNAAYSKLLQLPYLALSDEHRANLIERGLDSETIRRNGYATYRPAKQWAESHPKYEKMKKRYEDEHLEDEKKKFSRIAKLPPIEIIGGMCIADDLMQTNPDILFRVPGFFTLKQHWCLNMIPGMVIPTRTINGDIVCLQVRRDKDLRGVRYMTVSSKSLDNGPTAGIGRIHFPLGNAKLRDGAKVYLTEGPLKSDIASHLMDSPSIFIAILGVDNTSELPKYLDMLRAQGVTEIYNALDMDKLTNIFVAKACRRLSNMLNEHGISFPWLLWDNEYIVAKDRQCRRLCAENGIQINSNNPIHLRIIESCEALSSKKIEHNVIKTQKGEICHENWRSRTKGIDDWLKLIRTKETKA